MKGEATVRRLVEELAFDPELAAAAVDAIADKDDIALAIDWLLDHGAEDRGGAVTFRTDCPHVTGELLVPASSLTFRQWCEDCGENVAETWLCLHCGTARCGRYRRGHALAHADERHHVAVGLGDLSTWCYLCNSYVEHPSLQPLVERLRELKFGEEAVPCSHGTLGDPSWPRPRRLLEAEYRDHDDVLDAKLERLAASLRAARHAVVYSDGSSFAAASGERQATTTTRAHRAVAQLVEGGFVRTWVDLSAEALPQQAGISEANVIAIHGSLFDPSNPPPLADDGNLRPDLVERLLLAERDADLVLALGTAADGLTAGRVAASVATRARAGLGHGTALVASQRTPFDEHAQLRIFAPVDEVVVALLVRHLGEPLVAAQENAHEDAVVFVLRGYDPHSGLRSEHGSVVLDLTPGRRIKLAGQPKWDECSLGTVVGRDSRGNFRIRLDGGSDRVLGHWWIDAARRRAVPRLPLVPHATILEEEDDDDEGYYETKSTVP